MSFHPFAEMFLEARHQQPFPANRFANSPGHAHKWHGTLADGGIADERAYVGLELLHQQATMKTRTEGPWTEPYHTRGLELLRNLSDGFGWMAQGVKGADDSAHAASCHTVRCEPFFLQHCQYTDVGESAGSTSAEHQSEVGTIVFDGSGHRLLVDRRVQASSSRSSSR